MKLLSPSTGKLWKRVLFLSLLLATPLTSQPAQADDYMYEDEIEYALAKIKKERQDLSNQISANPGSIIQLQMVGKQHSKILDFRVFSRSTSRLSTSRSVLFYKMRV